MCTSDTKAEALQDHVSIAVENIFFQFHTCEAQWYRFTSQGRFHVATGFFSNEKITSM